MPIKETMRTVAVRLRSKQRRWLEREARRRKADRSEVLRALVDAAVEQDRCKRQRARQATKELQAAGEGNRAEIGRRLGISVDGPSGETAQGDEVAR